MNANTLIILLAVMAFVLAHVFGGRAAYLSGAPRSVWLSAAGGISVAYVFVHVLPELSRYQEVLGVGARNAGVLASIERHAYLIALLGLGLFYGIERLVRTAGRRRADDDGAAPLSIFWMHLAAFSLYNILVGYLLLHREENDLRGLVVYAVAMSLHFVVNAEALRKEHGATYHRYGRWLLAVAPIVGLVIGLAIPVSPLALSALFAFLAGGIILNVLKEELPEDRESRFWAFAVGAAFYSGLLLLTEPNDASGSTPQSTQTISLSGLSARGASSAREW